VSAIKNGVATEWEPAANKTLVLACRNATAILSFAGLAFVDGLPTDNWLARSILDADLPTNRPGRGGIPLMKSSSISFTLGSVMEHLKESIRSDFTKERSEYRNLGLSLLLTGYTWKRSRRGLVRPRPFQFKFRYADDASTGFIKREILPAPRWIPPGMAAYDWIGGGLTDESDLCKLAEQFSSRIGATTEVEAVLAEQIRSIAARPEIEGVGNECHIVSITRSQQIRVCFMRNESSPNTATYTPWVLGEGWAWPPMYQESIDGIEISLNDWRRLKFATVPPVGPPANYVGMGSQIRKPWIQE
jgi:hypothetical protein